MRIESLKLKGITAFPGVVDIDCTALPTGVIAIVGPNGHGKTSLLESLGPAPIYREFPSRAERELFDYATGTDSYIEQTVTLDGRGTYRLRVNLDRLRRKTDAVIEQVLADGRRVALNDGKTTTYDAAVKPLFPSIGMVLASAFAAQNRAGSFVTGSKAERKALFAELLELGHLEKMAKTANTIANTLERRRIALGARLDVLEPLTLDAIVQAHSDTANRLQVEIGQLEERALLLDAAQRTHIDAVSRARQAVDDARAAGFERTALATRYSERSIEREREAAQIPVLSQQLADRLGEIRRRCADAMARIDGRRQALLTAEIADVQLMTQVQRINARLATDRQDREERIANNEKLRADGDSIRSAVAALPGALNDVATAKQALADATKARETQRTEIATLRSAVQAMAKPQVELEMARRAAELLERMPCKGAAPYDGCEFLRDATAAKQRIGALEARLEGLGRITAELQGLVAGEADTAAAVDRADQQLATFERTASDLAAVAARKDRLDAAETRLTELQAELTQLEARAESERADARAQRDADIAAAAEMATSLTQESIDTQAQADRDAATESAQLNAQADACRQRIETLDAELATITAARDALPPAADVAALEQALLDAELAQRTHQSDVTRLAADRARCVSEIAQQQARHAELTAQLKERDALRAQLAALDHDLVEWQVLERALGANGLPVIEMDAAGPAISELTNDLLEHALGTRRFTVELVTQEAKVSGKGLKETFDLKVYDTDRGAEPREVSDLSGGEQVLIDEALKGAIALFNNARNVMPLRTCWRDETTGALDADNALRYMAMLRRIQERGGFERLYVISHNAEAAALADAQLYVHDGQVETLYPPFAPVLQEVA